MVKRDSPSFPKLVDSPNKGNKMNKQKGTCFSFPKFLIIIAFVLHKKRELCALCVRGREGAERVWIKRGTVQRNLNFIGRNELAAVC